MGDAKANYRIKQQNEPVKPGEQRLAKKVSCGIAVYGIRDPGVWAERQARCNMVIVLACHRIALGDTSCRYTDPMRSLSLVERLDAEEKGRKKGMLRAAVSPRAMFFSNSPYP